MPGSNRHLTAHAEENLDLQVILRGSGPLLVLLPGATGSQTGYAALIRLLSSDHTLVVYDRRGHGRNALPGNGIGNDTGDGAAATTTAATASAPTTSASTSADPITIAQHARDTAAVIDAIGEGPAIIVGSSAGATIGLELLTRSPQRVTRLLAHEPPLVALLDDGQRWRTWYDSLVEINERVGTQVAFDYFFAHLISNGLGEQAQVTVPASQLPEWSVYFQRELEQIVAYEPDVAELKNARDKLIPILGADSRDRWHGRAALTLADQTGTDVVEVPGGHLAPVYEPIAFAKTVSIAAQR